MDDPLTALRLYLQIYRDRPEPDQTSAAHIQLKLTGIVKRDDHGRLVVRNKIYRLIFTEDWATTAIGGWWNVPYPHNPNFTGREAILTQLKAALVSGMPAAMSQAIVGLGGIGKTQTAVEYAYRHRDQYRAVLWVRADTETSLVSGYRELAEVLGLPEKDEGDGNKMATAVRRLARPRAGLSADPRQRRRPHPGQDLPAARPQGPRSAHLAGA